MRTRAKEGLRRKQILVKLADSMGMLEWILDSRVSIRGPCGGRIHRDKDPRKGANAIPLGVRKPTSGSKSKVPENGKVDAGFQKPEPDNECWLSPISAEDNKIEVLLDVSNGKDKGENSGEETKSLVSFSLGELKVKVSNSVKNIEVGYSALEEICDYLGNKALICKFIGVWPSKDQLWSWVDRNWKCQDWPGIRFLSKAFFKGIRKWKSFRGIEEDLKQDSKMDPGGCMGVFKEEEVFFNQEKEKLQDFPPDKEDLEILMEALKFSNKDSPKAFPHDTHRIDVRKASKSVANKENEAPRGQDGGTQWHVEGARGQ
ncbi:hypothetical protein KI387_022946 [Taxus chinensis]|uniref:Uncharacterized protein n=1 Tax=Taxus chinensis TaxID=29808 RepID=A0AA38G1C6_TAXCH|nr:hypothetical protein KI387_022946 [Taxus chinensis]